MAYWTVIERTPYIAKDKIQEFTELIDDVKEVMEGLDQQLSDKHKALIGDESVMEYLYNIVTIEPDGNILWEDTKNNWPDDYFFARLLEKYVNKTCIDKLIIRDEEENRRIYYLYIDGKMYMDSSIKSNDAVAEIILKKLGIWYHQSTTIHAFQTIAKLLWD